MGSIMEVTIADPLKIWTLNLFQNQNPKAVLAFSTLKRPIFWVILNPPTYPKIGRH